MPWEAHVTVRDDDVEGWLDYCTRLSRSTGGEVKPLYIELATGGHPKQLMFAARWEGGPDFSRSHIAVLAKLVRQNGFTVLREKLECPLDKSYGIEPHPSSYSESHMKLMIPRESARIVVDMACEHADVHASRNLLADEEGLQKWYLTQRDHGVNRQLAASTFNHGLSLVQEAYPAVRMEMEYVAYDSNPELDRGWAEG